MDNMAEYSLMHLHLRTPLKYTKATDLNHFAGKIPEDEELIFCFELNREQASRFDPQAELFPGELIFAGRKCNGETAQPEHHVPIGMYLFVQQRRALCREECITLAIEQQKDGLWEQLKLENRLYVRYLFEDGSPVTQLFRRYEE